MDPQEITGWWETLTTWADWGVHWIGRLYALVSVVCIVFYALVPRGKYPRIDRFLGVVSTIVLDLWNLRQRWKDGGLPAAATVVDEAKNRTWDAGAGAGTQAIPSAPMSPPETHVATVAPGGESPPPPLHPDEVPTPSAPVSAPVSSGASTGEPVIFVADDERPTDPRATSLHNPPPAPPAALESPVKSPPRVLHCR